MNKTNEEWRTIEGYEGLYEVSSLGRVRSIPKKHSYPKCAIGILSPSTNKAGYKRVTLCKEGRTQGFSVHRLVAAAFLGKPSDNLVVNHIDENPSNNELTNLEWVTPRQNLEHSNVINKMINAATRAKEKAVQMYSKAGEFICEFESTTKAAKHIGSYQQLVSECCKNWNKSTKGYKFKFKK